MFRKVLLPGALLVSILFIAADLFASGPGGIVTNTNQSPEYIRILNRQASTGVDAVLFQSRWNGEDERWHPYWVQQPVYVQKILV